jgi:DNA-binding CsgD family transcriptional regulator
VKKSAWVEVGMSALQSVELPATEGLQSNSFAPGPRLLFCGPPGEGHRSLQLLNNAVVCALDIQSVEELLQAVSATAPELIVLDFGTLRRLLPGRTPSFSPAEDLEYALSELDPRQADVVRMIAKGLRNREIATSLGLSSRTVKAILSSLYLRYDVTNRTELLGLLMEQGHLAGTRLQPGVDLEREGTMNLSMTVVRASQQNPHCYGPLTK